MVVLFIQKAVILLYSLTSPHMMSSRTNKLYMHACVLISVSVKNDFVCFFACK